MGAGIHDVHDDVLTPRLTRLCRHVMDSRSGVQGRWQVRQFRTVEAVGGQNDAANQIGECLHGAFCSGIHLNGSAAGPSAAIKSTGEAPVQPNKISPCRFGVVDDKPAIGALDLKADTGNNRRQWPIPAGRLCAEGALRTCNQASRIRGTGPLVDPNGTPIPLMGPLGRPFSSSMDRFRGSGSLYPMRPYLYERQLRRSNRSLLVVIK